MNDVVKKAIKKIRNHFYIPDSITKFNSNYKNIFINYIFYHYRKHFRIIKNFFLPILMNYQACFVLQNLSILIFFSLNYYFLLIILDILEKLTTF